MDEKKFLLLIHRPEGIMSSHVSAEELQKFIELVPDPAQRQLFFDTVAEGPVGAELKVGRGGEEVAQFVVVRIA